MIETLRKSDLSTIAATLESQRARALDVVVRGDRLRVENARFVIEGTEAELTAGGVTTHDGMYEPGEVADEGIANKLDIPQHYLRKLHEGHRALYDHNVNWWLQRQDKRFMLRLLHHTDMRQEGPHGLTHGFIRAFLSERYRTIDNLDILLSALQGIEDAGVVAPKIDADLTERRMYIRVSAPEIKVLAKEWLKNYRGPGGVLGRDNPVVWAGFILTNSEVGQGAFSITPRMVVQVCKNGQTVPKDAMREVHLGATMDEGIVKWSAETITNNLQLVRSMTTDAVRTFLDVDYLRQKVREVEEKAGAAVNHPQETITAVSKRLVFSKAQQESILNHFIDGADRTAGGVANAITCTAQDEDNGDVAAMLENRALAALEFVAKLPVLTR